MFSAAPHAVRRHGTSDNMCENRMLLFLYDKREMRSIKFAEKQ